ncbi:MAG: competence/damage-inducible protein A [candidate division WOR-3 bacterium]|nr:competence/damage-inducible protein A [candidate division WOR-3 bacterium]
MLNAQIIIIGNEVLSGRTLDINSNFLAKRLQNLGITLNRITVIGDEKSTIEKTVSYAIEHTDIVLVSGGLGPTPDDQTVASIAKIFKRRLILDESILAKLEMHFQNQNIPMPELAMRQALIPQSAIVLNNPVGTAPGIIIKSGKKSVILLPGVPIELQKIFETGVVPFLTDTYALQPSIELVVRTTNIPETAIVERISDILKKYKDIAVAYLPSITGVDIKITNIRDKKHLSDLTRELSTRLKPYVYVFGEETIEEVVGNLLRKKQLLLSVAESCTGGLIADRITNVPGSSEYFIGGAVVYSNRLKNSICHVRNETLRKFGAVSKETVLEMAKGIKENFGADIGIGVSGIAGPSGQTAQKPIGLVYIGIATKKGQTYEEHHFTGTRRMIKEKSAMAALDLLRRTIETI